MKSENGMKDAEERRKTDCGYGDYTKEKYEKRPLSFAEIHEKLVDKTEEISENHTGGNHDEDKRYGNLIYGWRLDRIERSGSKWDKIVADW